jgi:hypothetical protein
VAASEATAHVAASEATAHVAASEAATMPGGLGIRPHRYTERDGGEDGHGRACGGLPRDALNEVHGVASTSCTDRCQDVFHCCHSIKPCGSRADHHRREKVQS